MSSLPTNFVHHQPSSNNISSISLLSLLSLWHPLVTRTLRTLSIDSVSSKKLQYKRIWSFCLNRGGVCKPAIAILKLFGANRYFKLLLRTKLKEVGKSALTKYFYRITQLSYEEHLDQENASAYKRSLSPIPPQFDNHIGCLLVRLNG
ncbi:unnamed protein product [Lactuca saligna]|uniref:Uncharacterized protein n=1 Tax=Lactuca saligna TaxID=75948 RepID=A0AA36DX86_LACSI|nr:unnamed protein product [Lactuca saligna]